MPRETIAVDNYTYEGTDAHRTLHNLGKLWEHHVHRRTPNAETVQRSADALATLFAPLAGNDHPTLAPAERLTQIGEQAAKRIDDLDPRQLERALRDMWAPFAALADDTRNGDQSATAVVSGLFLSDGGVPKTAVDSVEIGYRGVLGDRQASRAHHGRPWQALCLWSSDVVADFAKAGHPIHPGSAGENVSIRGLDWSQARPGVRLQVGAVRVTLTAYAIPCQQNARWFTDGDYEHMSHERSDHSRLYALVDQPGRISVGDSVHLAG
jgi:MOSC domain-containing protein YiiM